ESIAADASRRPPDATALGPAERWIRSRAAATAAEVDKAIAEYQLAEVTRALYDGIWSEFCDWGLELAKVRLADTSLPDATREATWWTLVEALDTYLRLLHPVMPYITEELWSVLPHAPEDPELLIVAAWPDAAALAARRDPALEAQIGQVLELITAVRNARATVGIPPSEWRQLEVQVRPDLAPTFDHLAAATERLARVRPLRRVEAFEGDASASIGIVAGTMEARLQAQVQATDADRSRI